MKSKYNVVDLFSGAGGMSNGFEQDGRFHVALGTDHDSAASGSYKVNHPESGYIKANVCYLKGEDICYGARLNKEDIDLIVGGTPCQGFSTLGKRMVSDPRNLLFCEYARIVEEIRPKMFVLENVGGLKTMKSAEDSPIYEMVKTAFSKIGYEVKSYLLNAANFGVPQERKRLIFIGCRYKGIKFVEPEKSHYLEGEPNIDVSGRKLTRALTIMDAISDLPEIEPGQEGKKYKNPRNEYQRFMRNLNTTEEVKELLLHKSGQYSDKLKLIMKTIPPGSGKTIWQLNYENPEMVPDEAMPSSGFLNTYGRLSPDVPSMTITRNFSCVSSSRCIHPFQNRSLTSREAARIQSFKDDFIFADSDLFQDGYEEKINDRQDISHFADFVPEIAEKGKIFIYKRPEHPIKYNVKDFKSVMKKNTIKLLIGNAVPPLLGKAIAGAVAVMLNQISEKEQNGELENISFLKNEKNKQKEHQPSFGF